MKITTLSLVLLNSLPLLLYPFIAVPLMHLLKLGGGSSESGFVHFMTLGFAWGALLFPAILAYNHFFSYRNYKKGMIKQSLTNQMITTFYLVLLLVYGYVSLGQNS